MITYIVLAIVLALLVQRFLKGSGAAKPAKAAEKDFRDAVKERHALVDGETRVYSAEEVARHNTVRDCWMIVDGCVYDVTDFVDLHPGGVTSITRLPGQDNSKDFHGPQHTGSRAQDTIADFLIGVVAGSKAAEAAAAADAKKKTK